MNIPLKPLAAAALIAFASPAAAACFADYKASQGGKKLGLHYGVMQIADDACAGGGKPEKEVKQRLKDGGWKLLNIMSVFGPEGLDERRASAGEYYLRY